MSCHASIELIRGQAFLARSQTEPFFWNDHMQITSLNTNRAVTLIELKRLGCIDLEAYLSAVTTTFVPSHSHNVPCLPRFWYAEENIATAPVALYFSPCIRSVQHGERVPA